MAAPLTSRRAKKSFTSKAGTSELREYQRIASNYPPLRHSTLLALSRKFVAGRNEQVRLEEAEVVRAVVGDDFTDAHLEECKDEVVSAYKKHIGWISEKRSAEEIIRAFFTGKNIEEIYNHRTDNILSDMVWIEPFSIAGVSKAIAECSYETFKASQNKIFLACAAALDEVKPHDVPKDIIDRWRARLAEMNTHYLTCVRSLKLSDADIRKAKRVIAAGNDALDEMVNHNLQLAMSRVGKIMKNNPRAQHIGVSDLIGAANMGLVLGARQFDPEMGRKFSTYAAYHIDGQLYEILSIEDGKSGIKGLTPHEQKQLNVIMSVKRSFEKIYHRAPTATELQSMTGISKVLISRRLNTPALSTQSINAPVRESDDESVMLSDVIASETTIETEMSAADMMNMVEALKEEVARLPRTYKIIVMGKMGIAPDGELVGTVKTSKQIAKEAGISPHDVPSKFADAIDMLRRRLAEKGWDGDALPFS